MKFLSITFTLSCLISFSAFSCPYQSMAEIDQRLYSPKTELTKDEFKEVVNLRQLGQVALEKGNIQESEEILNRALALIK